MKPSPRSCSATSRPSAADVGWLRESAAPIGSVPAARSARNGCSCTDTVSRAPLRSARVCAAMRARPESPEGSRGSRRPSGDWSDQQEDSAGDRYRHFGPGSRPIIPTATGVFAGDSMALCWFSLGFRWVFAGFSLGFRWCFASRPRPSSTAARLDGSATAFPSFTTLEGATAAGPPQFRGDALEVVDSRASLLGRAWRHLLDPLGLMRLEQH